ncbi:MAG: hypothetical protein WAW86_00850 [Gammaproteobacteria bacterium]
MLNDQGDKYEGHEDGEYHFSDEETVSYEVENDPSKVTTSSSAGGESFMNKITRSKRMLISLGVFLVLVFVVYKMVAPSNDNPAAVGDIAAVSSIPARPMTQQPQQPQQQPVAAVAQQPMQQPVQQPVAEVPPAPLQQAMMAPEQQPPAPLAQPMNNQPTNVMPQQVTENIPVPTQAGGYPANVPVVGQVPTAVPVNNEQVITQMQNEYEQRASESANQNKALQDQLQALNSRVAMMETQMTQMVQALTSRQSQNAMESAPAPVVDNAPRVAYSVQAIIPGRAWLRSDNGETVTVAEGDVVKQLGRVTKIDPYDGVVEVSTGNKMISLSYGNGG